MDREYPDDRIAESACFRQNCNFLVTDANCILTMFKKIFYFLQIYVFLYEFILLFEGKFYAIFSPPLEVYHFHYFFVNFNKNVKK